MKSQAYKVWLFCFTAIAMTESELIQHLDQLPAKDKEQYILSTIQSNPSYYRFKNRLANLYISNNQIYKAEAILTKELSREYNVHLQITLAHLELKCNSLDKAKKTIALLQKNNPRSPHTHIVVGRLKVKECKESEAIQAFRKAHELNPKVVKPVVELQSIYLKTGDVEKAKSIILSGLKHRPKNHSYLNCLGKIWQQLGEIEKAYDAFERSRQYATNETQAGNAAIQLALLRINQFSDNEVIRELHHFISIYPSHIGIRLNLIRFLINTKFYKEALLEIDNFREIAPDDIRAEVNKIIIYQRQGLLEKAEALCDVILEKNPKNLNGLLLKADLLSLREQTQEAFILFNKSIELHPSFSSAYARFAQFLFQEGDVMQSLKTLEKGILKSKKIDNLVHKSIQILVHTGSYERAISKINAQKNGRRLFDPKIKYLELQLYQRKGNFTKAKQLADAFLQECQEGSTWEINVLKFLSETAFIEYDYQKAEDILKDLVNSAKDANMLRNRLALLYVLKGDLENAKMQLTIATQEIVEKETSGKVLIPLTGHTAKVLNELLINPILKEKAIASFAYKGKERLTYLADLSLAHSDYFGFSLYLSNELRAQSILKDIKESLRKSPSTNKIPKKIIQYWDSGTPPTSVQHIMQSWKALNPNFEYHLFSRKSAYVFLKQELGYDAASAFKNCEHPALQADYFRLAYLSKVGGFYADADDKCVSPLDKLVSSGAELVLKLGDFGCISNNFIGAAPENEIIRYAFEKGITNMLTYFNEGPWFKLGPGHLTKSVTYYLSKYIQEKDFTKWPRIYTLDQIETRQHLSQHLSLPYKSSNKSWFTAEYKKTITKTKAS